MNFEEEHLLVFLSVILAIVAGVAVEKYLEAVESSKPVIIGLNLDTNLVSFAQPLWVFFFFFVIVFSGWISLIFPTKVGVKPPHLYALHVIQIPAILFIGFAFIISLETVETPSDSVSPLLSPVLPLASPYFLLGVHAAIGGIWNSVLLSTKVKVLKKEIVIDAVVSSFFSVLLFIFFYSSMFNHAFFAFVIFSLYKIAINLTIPKAFLLPKN